ncbi:MAG: aldo/keto reductase [Candidatus Zixiibacteriota bacterium]|nr:MAG: aldo/keto reductase [candidate division Zixibacteria bacterium]
MMDTTRSQLSRRKFLSRSVGCLASASLIGLTPESGLGQDDTGENSSGDTDIIYRKLGKTGVSLPIVSMGVMNANNPNVVAASYELGVRHFDSAAIYQYGRNEQMVGEVINRLGVRDKVFIATKTMRPEQREGLNSDQMRDKLLEVIDGSLQRLKTDYVDLLYVHSVSVTGVASDPGLIDGMNTLKKQGKIRASGISTHRGMVEVIDDMIRAGAWDVVMAPINIGLASDDALMTAIKRAADSGLGVVAMKTQSGGRRLNPEVLARYDSTTMATASLKWVLRHEHVHTAIPGYDNYEHMRECFSVVGNLEYTPEEKNLLSDDSIQLGMNYCHQCERCLASCPHSVDIPRLMRTYMYATAYGNAHEARTALSAGGAGNALRPCVSCDACVAECVRSIDVPGRVSELKDIYG